MNTNELEKTLTTTRSVLLSATHQLSMTPVAGDDTKTKQRKSHERDHTTGLINSVNVELSRVRRRGMNDILQQRVSQHESLRAASASMNQACVETLESAERIARVSVALNTISLCLDVIAT